MDRSQYEAKELSPRMLDVSSFDQLTEQEKLYAYWMTKASHYGCTIVPKQTSPESHQALKFFVEIFRKTQPVHARELLCAKFNHDDVKKFMTYVATIMFNYGNYRGYGDTKIVPELKKDIFVEIMKTFDADDKLIDDLYSLNDDNKFLDYPDKGQTMYYSDNMTSDDVAKVTRFMTKRILEPWNTRVSKHTYTKSTIYEIHTASVFPSKNQKVYEEFEDCVMCIRWSDYCKELMHIVMALEHALKYALNPTQKSMIENYIEHFRYGDINKHKDAQVDWIKDKAPPVETNLGFIERYRDPSKQRSEFEAFVAVVNKKDSEVLQKFVDRAEEFLKILPWDDRYNKKFSRPDFTSIDVLAFVASGMPLGINIPNYDDIRQSHGSKNVSLGNIIKTSLKKKEKSIHLTEEDNDLYDKFAMDAFNVQVAGHELLGHGSGKMFTENDHPEGETYYKPGESYDGIFGEWSPAYEECRAECIGMILCSDPEAHKLFGVNKADRDNFIVSAWMQIMLLGVSGMMTYDIDKKKWNQAHSHARFVINKVLLERDPNMMTFEVDKENDNFIVHFDRESILKNADGATRDFVTLLQVHKSRADGVKGNELFAKYTTPSADDLEIRRIYIKNMEPREQYIQPHIYLDGGVQIKKYDDSVEGEIESFVDNYPY